MTYMYVHVLYLVNIQTNYTSLITENILLLYGFEADVDTRQSRAIGRICFDLVIMVVNASGMCECYANIILIVDNV